MSNARLLQNMEARPAASNHMAQLYRTDGELADSVSRFIAEGLDAGEAVLIIATASHWALFVARLATMPCIDLASAIVSGQLRIMNADFALSTIMVDGMPQWHRFQETANRIIEKSHKRFGKLRVYGEMASILWQNENRLGAERLESHWNALSHRHDIVRLCAYRVNEADAKGYNAVLECVCRTHSRLLPPSGYREGDARATVSKVA